MHNRNKHLEDLVASAIAEIDRLKAENELLAGKVRVLEEARGKAITNSAAMKELADFKARLKRRLQRLCEKIDKADLQPGLFGGGDE